MTIDIRNPMFEARQLVDEIVESAIEQAKVQIKEIVSGFDLDDETQQAACQTKVTEYLLGQVRQFNCTTYMTDSVDGFISALVVRKLTEMAINPGSAILEAKWGF